MFLIQWLRIITISLYSNIYLERRKYITSYNVAMFWHEFSFLSSIIQMWNLSKQINDEQIRRVFWSSHYLKWNVNLRNKQTIKLENVNGIHLAYLVKQQTSQTSANASCAFFYCTLNASYLCTKHTFIFFSLQLKCALPINHLIINNKYIYIFFTGCELHNIEHT